MSFLLKTESYNPEILSLEETLYHCANGYVGMRGNIDEAGQDNAGSIRGTYINGFFDTHPIHHPEKLCGFPETGERILNVTDTQGLAISVGGEVMKPETGMVTDYRRELDMRRGICCRNYTWQGRSGVKVDFEARRLASFSRPEFIAMEYRLTAREESDIEISSLVEGRVENFSDPDDPRVSGEGFRSLEVERSSVDDSVIEMLSVTENAKIRLQVLSRHRLRLQGREPAGREIQPEGYGAPGERAGLGWSLHMKAGESLVLEKINRFRDSRRYPGGFNEDSGIRESGYPDFATLEMEQKRYLDRFWRDADVRIEGDDHLLAGLRYSLYGLLQSGSRDSLAGIPAKGLSGEGYEGHFFWDTEIYMFPFFLHTRPELALRLLEFRYQTLPAARRQARNLGHSRGAAYPWRTITGRECSAYYPSGSAQYHINADIAYSIRRYVEATGDTGFLEDKGAEILIETARIWMETGNTAPDGRFHIHGVTGPDEYTCLVNDNYYTNRMAADNLQYAADTVRRLEKDAPAAMARLVSSTGLDIGESETWLQAAENMYIPYHKELGINPQDTSFLNKPEWDFEGRKVPGPLLLHYHHMTLSRHQVCKQADTILAHLLLGGETEETMRQSFDYYEKRTTHDSSLSYAAFAIMAARLGDTEKALEYFRENASLDLDNSHGNTRDGIHAANMGGAWATIVQGFGGFFPEDGIPAFSPRLPESWKALEYRIRWKGASIAVTADHIRVVLRLIEGPALEIFLYGRRLLLEDSMEAGYPAPEDRT